MKYLVYLFLIKNPFLLFRMPINSAAVRFGVSCGFLSLIRVRVGSVLHPTPSLLSVRISNKKHAPNQTGTRCGSGVLAHLYRSFLYVNDHL
nr:uncharacterized protein LOC129160899 isoform X2 [Nothobranchius furzeri]